MAVGKRTRFEVLKRHNFRCFYCGASPLQNALTVKLHADHVEPKSLGGEDDPANLVAACVDCNLGKSNVRLDDKRFASSFSSEEEREQADQIREYLRVQRDVAAAKRDAESIVLEHWQERIGEFHWQLPRFVAGAIREFGVDGAIEAVDIVARKGISGNMAQIRYFCGVLRNWRQPKEVSPKTGTDEINAARWDIAITTLQAYCRHRWGLEDSPDIGDLIKRAIGSTKDKPAPVSLMDVYQAIDNAQWLTEYDETGESQLMHFKAEMDGAISGDGDVSPETFVSHTIDGFYRECARRTARGAGRIWKDLCRTDADGEAEGVFTDIIEAMNVGYLYEAIKYCGERCPRRPLNEQLAILRRFVADDLGGDFGPRHLGIKHWAEWHKSDPEDDGEA